MPVDHTCYKCGSPVESGVPFCPHCRAPQIRVGVIEEAPLTTMPAEQENLGPVANPSTVQWSHALTAAALAGILSAILMNLFLGFFGIGIAAAGALAVRIYRQRSGHAALMPGAGARIGAVSGVFGFGFFCVLVAIGTAILGRGSQLKTAVLASLDQAAARSQDPQAQAAIEKLRTPEGWIFFLVFGLVFFFILFVGLSSLGGALAASMSRSKRKD